MIKFVSYSSRKVSGHKPLIIADELHNLSPVLRILLYDINTPARIEAVFVNSGFSRQYMVYVPDYDYNVVISHEFFATLKKEEEMNDKDKQYSHTVSSRPVEKTYNLTLNLTKRQMELLVNSTSDLGVSDIDSLQLQKVIYAALSKALIQS